MGLDDDSWRGNTDGWSWHVFTLGILNPVGHRTMSFILWLPFLNQGRRLVVALNSECFQQVWRNQSRQRSAGFLRCFHMFGIVCSNMFQGREAELDNQLKRMAKSSTIKCDSRVHYGPVINIH